MRTARMVALVALLSGGIAYGQSKVVYTLELDGNNHASDWENNLAPTFTPGVTSGAVVAGTDPTVNKPDLTWAVRVTVGGLQTGTDGDPGVGKFPLGAANLVFDLELRDSAGNLVAKGAAPLADSGGQNVPTDAGFWSSINDGDSAGTRGPDILANAAFAITLWNTETEPTQKTSLIDPAPTGPNFDYGWYPTANGRSGVDIDNTKAVVAVDNPSLNGKLVGFGAGMKSYDYVNYKPGVGKRWPSYDTPVEVYGFGAYLDDSASDGKQDPLNPLGIEERALFEGQLSVRGLLNGTYTLKVVPSVEGTNVIQGHVEYNSSTPNFGGFGSFAIKAQEVYPLATDNPGMTFEVKNLDVPDAAIKGRFVFYNQCFFDGNKVAIDAAPITGTVPNDDGDAVDTSKFPLIKVAGAPKTSVQENYTTYAKGLNGLVYDVALASRAPQLSDFTFKFWGRNGTTDPGTNTITPAAIGIWPGAGVDGSDRVFISFANNAVQDGWLQVIVGTGFGLPAEEEHWWGNARGEAKNNPANIAIDALDVGRVKAKYTLPIQAPVSYDTDFDKNRTCDAIDLGFCKSRYTNPGNMVLKITK